MIISNKHKYIFVGLPLSGSSAISKELIENYSGEPILEKHSNIWELKRKTDIRIRDFKVIACLRNPYELFYSQYSKFKANPNNVFTKTKYFVENGGHVTKGDRRLFKSVQEGLSYHDFVKRKFVLPVDNLFSYNYKYLDIIINFHNLNSSFQDAIRKIGLEPKRDLPIVNKTRKKDEGIDFADVKNIPRVFKPFLNEYGSYIDIKCRASYLDLLLFRLLRSIRIQNWRIKFSKRKHSIEAYSNDKYYKKLDLLSK
jgi:hypothetical protein